MESAAMVADGAATLSLTGRRLRFMTCGSVDDGKSTLVGRLLYDSGSVYEDHIAEVRRAAGCSGPGPASDGIDFAFLVDGLRAEREQGITIDVAYRYFSTTRRSFMIADAPGHEQFTRNQAAAASQTDLAVVVVSAVEGIRAQTRRHMAIAALFGVRDMIVAVNKMDLAGFDRGRFGELETASCRLADALGVRIAATIPLSARGGHLIVSRSEAMPWHAGPTLLEALEDFRADSDEDRTFRLPIQMTGRLDGGGRVSLGTIASGDLSRGQTVCADPAHPAVVTGLWAGGEESDHATAGDAVALRLSPELDLGRGVVLFRADCHERPAAQVRVRFVWLDADPLLPGRSYDCLIGCARIAASVTRVEGRIDLDRFETRSGEADIRTNDIAVGLLTFAQPAPATPFALNPRLGAFILVDRSTRRTMAAGVVVSIERHGDDTPWQAIAVPHVARAAMKLQRPFVLWFTGLSGAGKSTLADLLDRRLHAMGLHTTVLDGDNLRHGLNSDLGFGDADRVENMRRVAHVARLFVDAGIIVLVALISPFAAERRRAREVVGEAAFVEIFVDAPVEICGARDPKGHYARAASGALPRFTGISASYEPPAVPDIHVPTAQVEPAAAADMIVAHLREAGLIPR